MSAITPAELALRTRLRTLCNDAATRAGVSFLEPCAYGWAVTVLQEANFWHVVRRDPDSLVAVEFTPEVDGSKLSITLRDDTGETQTLRST